MEELKKMLDDFEKKKVEHDKLQEELSVQREAFQAASEAVTNLHKEINFLRHHIIEEAEKL